MIDSIFDLPHDQARTLLRSGAPVYVPVNPFEYHGPHLPLSNDAVVSAGLIRDLHARLRERHPDWALLAVPDLCVGTGTTPGPGSRPSSFARVRSLVQRACRTLADLGARRVVLMTFHGDPLHNVAVHAGVELLSAGGVRAVAPMHLLLRQLLRLGQDDPFPEILELIEDPRERESMRRELEVDLHAGFAETSLTLHYAPSSVSASYRELAPCPPVRPVRLLLALAEVARALGRPRLASELAHGARGLGWFGLRPFPGYTTRPHLASAEAGAAIARRIVDLYVDVVDDVLHGAPAPRPIMGWLETVSFGGRLGGWRRSPGG